MSYGLRIVGDAAADLRALPTDLAESVLDALEVLATDPTSLRIAASGEAVFDLVRETESRRHTIFLRINVDSRQQRLTVLGIADYVH